MGRCAAVICTGIVLPLLAPSLPAHVWTVGGADGDFSEIQPAIDAATAGDTILVRPGTYLNLVLNKGVLVRASDEPFLLAFGGAIRDVPTGQTAGLGGAETQGYPLLVENCRGEVVLEDLQLFAGENTLWIQQCPNVSASGIDVRLGSGAGSSAVSIETSTVQMTEFVIHGNDGSTFFERDGGAALSLTDSRVMLSNGELRGGAGGLGSCPGNGGDALQITRSQVHLIGNGSETFQGGAGGDSTSAECPGGQGGNGVSSTGLSVIRGSGVNLLPGAGGGGPGASGQEGLPTQGAIPIWSNPVPQLTVTGNLNPGDTFHAELTQEEAGTALLLLGGAGGWTPYGSLGPGLGIALQGSWFQPVLLGSVPGASTTPFDSVLGQNSDLLGLIVHAQGAVFAESGALQLSNKVVRTVGE